MSTRTYQLDENVHNYLVENSVRDRDVLRRLRQETASMESGAMQISPEQGQFMQMLIQATGARRALEVGTFTGYSALCVALALPDEGRLVACDVSREFTDRARPFWAEAGVDHKIDLRIGPALQTLDQMLEKGEAERFDFAFIDADKENYDGYYERCLQLVRTGGLIGIDNMLWSGRVADASQQDESTTAIRALTKKIHGDERVVPSLLPIGDGLLLAWKR